MFIVFFALIALAAALFMSVDIGWFFREERLIRRHPFYELPLRERLKVIRRALRLDFRPLFRLHHAMTAADHKYARRYFRVQKLKVHLLRTLFLIWVLLMACGAVFLLGVRNS